MYSGYPYYYQMARRPINNPDPDYALLVDTIPFNTYFQTAASITDTWAQPSSSTNTWNDGTASLPLYYLPRTREAQAPTLPVNTEYPAEMQNQARPATISNLISARPGQSGNETSSTISSNAVTGVQSNPDGSYGEPEEEFISGIELSGYFQCASCLDKALPPVMQCEKGHLMCKKCQMLSLSMCKFCQKPASKFYSYLLFTMSKHL